MTPPFFHRRFLLPLAAALLTGCTKAPTPPDEPPPAPVTWQAATLAAPGEWVELVGAAQPLPGNVGRITAPSKAASMPCLWSRTRKARSSSSCTRGMRSRKASRSFIWTIASRVSTATRRSRPLAPPSRKSPRPRPPITWPPPTWPVNSLFRKIPFPRSRRPARGPSRRRPRTPSSKPLTAQQRRDEAKPDVKTLDAEFASTRLRPNQGRLGRIQASVGQTLSACADVAEIVYIETISTCPVSNRNATRPASRRDRTPGWAACTKAGDACSPDGQGQVPTYRTRPSRYQALSS